MTELFEYIARRQAIDRATTVLVSGEPEAAATEQVVERLVDGLEAPRYNLIPEDDGSTADLLDEAARDATMVVRLTKTDEESLTSFLLSIKATVASQEWQPWTWIWVAAEVPDRARECAHIEVVPRLVGEVYKLHRDDFGESLYRIAMKPVTVDE